MHRKPFRVALGGVLILLSAASSAPPATRPGVAKPSPELLKLWADLDPKRDAALKLAKTVTEGTKAQARRNRDELMEATRAFNEALAPIAAASPVKPTGIAPRKGIEKAIWFYKLCRQVELYNAAHREEMSEEEYRSVQLLNEYRECLGAAPCEFDPRLHDAAMGHAQWMKESQQCEHEEPDVPGKKLPDQRMTRAGYHWTACAENVALGQTSPEMAFDAPNQSWFDSPGHHHNMVGDYVHVGIAMIDHAWVQNFATGMPAKAPAYKARPATRGATSTP